MDNLKLALENRIGALFAETKSSLINEAYKLSSSVNRNFSDNPIVNLKEKLIEGEQIMKVVGEGIIDFCNDKLTAFEEEINNINEPHKTEAINKYKDLLITETQRVLKELFNERVLG